MVRGLNTSTENELDWLSDFATGMTFFLTNEKKNWTLISCLNRFPSAILDVTVVQV